MKVIPLTQDQVALVDDEDYEWLSEFKWHAVWAPSTQSFYPQRSVPPGLEYSNKRLLPMHNAIWTQHNGPIPDGLTVDHKNRNTLEGRLSNLRLATRSQQKQNQGLHRNSTSGYRGVHWHRRDKKWSVSIQVDGKRIYLGYFTDKEDAARAYDVAARIHYGEFAQLNFP